MGSRHAGTSRVFGSQGIVVVVNILEDVDVVHVFDVVDHADDVL